MSEIFSQLGYLLSYDATQPLFFNSGLFLFLFLLFSGGYALLTGKHQTAVRLLYLTAFSYYFYYKNAGGYCVLLAIITLGNYFIGKMIEDAQDVKKKKILVSLAVTLMLSQLAYFKYTNFALSLVVPWAGGTFEPLDIFLPAGISFFTFQSMNYVIDVYRGKLKACRSLLDFSFFVSFFPTLLAGPILRARDFLPQVRQPLNVTREMFGLGLWFIMIGLFKKAIISDYIGVNFVNRIFDDPSLYTGLENLLGIYGYALKLYCDFSGYSDMAIGLGKIFGFHFPENFSYPYASRSITEFWRRWHISLSTWFRDYVYIPLGGNRKGVLKQLRNMAVVWFLTGLWHGAAWNFVLWGIYYGILLAFEKFVWGKGLAKLPKLVQHLYALLIVVFGFVIFTFDDMAALRTYLTSMLGMAGNPLFGTEVFWYLGNYGVVLIASCILAFPVYPWLKAKISCMGTAVTTITSALSMLGYMALFLLATAYLVNDTYNPFLYFRF